jgi:ParB/RepB/Spo0J family partition protein
VTHGLTPLHIQAEPLLRAIVSFSDAPKPPTSNDLAAAVQRDGANTRTALRSFEEKGLITRDPYALTAEGRRVLAILDRAAGKGGDQVAGGDANAVRLRHDQIVPDTTNARTTSGLSAEKIRDMAEMLADKGMLTPPRVLPRGDGTYQLVAGERRWRGWGKLIADGIWQADHTELCTIDASADEAERIEAGLVENLHREDLTNLEIANNLLLLHGLGRSVGKMAKVAKKTERFVQIALKVAREALDEDKAKFVESETAYRAAKDRGETVKRTFTWEDLRNSVVTPKHKAAMERKDRLLLLVAELAVKASLDDYAVQVGPEGVLHVGPGFTSLTEISVPPGGGHYSEAETLKLIDEVREDGRIYAGATDLALAWLNEDGFDKDPAGWLSNLRGDLLGPMVDRMLQEDGRFGTAFLNPPKIVAPAPAPAAPQAPPSAETGDLLAQADFADLSPEAALILAEAHYKACVDGVEMSGGDKVAIVHDRNFKELPAVRELRFSHLMLSTCAPGHNDAMRLTKTGVDWLSHHRLNPMTNDVALHILRKAANSFPVGGARFATAGLNEPQAAAPAAPAAPIAPAEDLAPGLKDAEFVALMELAHKIGKHPVTARGGSITGALVGAFFEGPGQGVATALVNKRLVAFIQAAPPATGFIAHLTDDGEELAEAVDDARLHEVWSEAWDTVSAASGLGEWVAFIQSGKYATAWLNVAEPLAIAPAGTKRAGLSETQLLAIELVKQVAEEAIEAIKAAPAHTASASHWFKLADRTVQTFHRKNMGEALANYARLRACAGPGETHNELFRSLKRLGLDYRVVELAYAPDSPDYAAKHRDCPAVTADEHGMAIIAADPAAPADDEEDPE